MQACISGRFVFATPLVTLGMTSPAAAVALSGHYVGVAWVPFTVTVVQTGTALQMIGHVVVNDTTAYPLAAAGTVDPATGAFSVAGEVTGLRADFAYTPPGCEILPYGGVDPATGTLLFWASCDPFGTNPYGDQLFAIRVDGTHLRQLTHARGLGTEPDGTVSTENIGPFAFSSIVGGRE